MSAPDKNFIERVATCIAQPGPNAPRGVRHSILAQAARVHGQKPLGDEATAPTGFDPAATALFEGTVESAYLVATADGPLDGTEDAVLRAIVGIGCDGKVSTEQMKALFDELVSARQRETEAQRAAHIAQMITNRDHQREVLRIAAIMARASGGVRPAERGLLDRLAKGFSLEPTAVDAAIAEAEETLRAM
jgi:tellurite resistance protein